jgi:hypothetical protein
MIFSEGPVCQVKSGLIQQKRAAGSHQVRRWERRPLSSPSRHQSDFFQHAGGTGLSALAPAARLSGRRPTTCIMVHMPVSLFIFLMMEDY